MSIETLQKRLDLKKAAIAKRLATTQKHVARYLKKKRSGKLDQYDCSYDDAIESARKLRDLIWERRDIERELADAIAKKPVIGPVLEAYRKELAASFIDNRKKIRDRLKDRYDELRNDPGSTWPYDRFGYDYAGRLCKRVGEYWDKKHHYEPKDGLEGKDLEAAQFYANYERIHSLMSEIREGAHETDEKIEKRSWNDAIALVDDLYERTKFYTGAVADYSGLYVDRDNSGYAIINGHIKGERGDCRVESIGAGGYNIQRWHVRVLVHAVLKNSNL